VQNNLDLQLATARITEARAACCITRFGTFPLDGLGVSATRNRQRVIAPGAEVREMEFNNFEGHLDASWELDVLENSLRAERGDC
jgi:outer membrane protein TolC